uniref:NADH dehydrogenase subunit 2 n=1 Tax=Euscopus rufipes TaxID=1906784 RepID=UPI00110F3A93|nr:NADH dehydrogenase subunit 2 [Euscopus rufipes]APO08884.1 NADH dehydrogenase subunit 2 [Euscopus rufipes]
MNLNKMMFMSVLVISTLITMSSNNWLGMWMGMEINLMSFIPFIKSKNNKKNSQGIMIYFLTQSISSIIMLFSIISNKFIFYMQYEEISTTMLMISLMIKLASAPFHMWLPEMMTNLKWMNCFFLMTWQKMAPLTLLSSNNNNLIFSFISLSTIIGAIGGLNNTSLRKILAYSSINHLSWMMMLLKMSKIWYMYMFLYSTILLMILLLFNMKNIYFINQITIYKLTMTEKLTISSLMMSLGGMPPFLGFVPKFMVIQNMINAKTWLIMLLMVMMSLITLFYYMRMMYPMIMIFNTKPKWTKNYFKSKTTMSILMINLMLPLTLMLPMF